MLNYVAGSKWFMGASVGNTTTHLRLLKFPTVDFDMDLSLTAQTATLGRLGAIVAHYKDPDTGKVNNLTVSMFQNGKIYVGFNEGSTDATLSQVTTITGSSNNSWQGNATHIGVKRRGDVITVKFYGWTLASQFNTLLYTLTINLNDDARYSVFKNRPGSGVMMSVAGNQAKLTVNSLTGQANSEYGSITFTAKDDNPLVKGSMTFLTRYGAPILRKPAYVADQSDRLVSTKQWAELYMQSWPVIGYTDTLSSFTTSTRDLTALAAALKTITGDNWTMESNAPFSLAGATIVDNGTKSATYGTPVYLTYCLVVDLSDACSNMEGQLLIGYN